MTRLCDSPAFVCVMVPGPDDTLMHILTWCSENVKQDQLLPAALAFDNGGDQG